MLLLLPLRHVEPECKHDAPQQVSTEAAFNGKIFRRCSCRRRRLKGVAAISVMRPVESTCDFPSRESPFLHAGAEIVTAASSICTSQDIRVVSATASHASSHNVLTLVPLPHRGILSIYRKKESFSNWWLMGNKRNNNPPPHHH